MQPRSGQTELKVFTPRRLLPFLRRRVQPEELPTLEDEGRDLYVELAGSQHPLPSSETLSGLTNADPQALDLFGASVLSGIELEAQQELQALSFWSKTFERTEETQASERTRQMARQVSKTSSLEAVGHQVAWRLAESMQPHAAISWGLRLQELSPRTAGSDPVSFLERSGAMELDSREETQKLGFELAAREMRETGTNEQTGRLFGQLKVADPTQKDQILKKLNQIPNDQVESCVEFMNQGHPLDTCLSALEVLGADFSSHISDYLELGLGSSSGNLKKNEAKSAIWTWFKARKSNSTRFKEGQAFARLVAARQISADLAAHIANRVGQESELARTHLGPRIGYDKNSAPWLEREVGVFPAWESLLPLAEHQGLEQAEDTLGMLKKPANKTTFEQRLAGYKPLLAPDAAMRSEEARKTLSTLFYRQMKSGASPAEAAEILVPVRDRIGSWPYNLRESYWRVHQESHLRDLAEVEHLERWLALDQKLGHARSAVVVCKKLSRPVAGTTYEERLQAYEPFLNADRELRSQEAQDTLLTHFYRALRSGASPTEAAENLAPIRDQIYRWPYNLHESYWRVHQESHLRDLAEVEHLERWLALDQKLGHARSAVVVCKKLSRPVAGTTYEERLQAYEPFLNTDRELRSQEAQETLLTHFYRALKSGASPAEAAEKIAPIRDQIYRWPYNLHESYWRVHQESHLRDLAEVEHLERWLALDQKLGHARSAVVVCKKLSRPVAGTTYEERLQAYEPFLNADRELRSQEAQDTLLTHFYRALKSGASPAEAAEKIASIRDQIYRWPYNLHESYWRVHQESHLRELAEVKDIKLWVAVESNLNTEKPVEAVAMARDLESAFPVAEQRETIASWLHGLADARVGPEDLEDLAGARQEFGWEVLQSEFLDQGLHPSEWDPTLDALRVRKLMTGETDGEIGLEFTEQDLVVGEVAIPRTD